MDTPVVLKSSSQEIILAWTVSAKGPKKVQKEKIVRCVITRLGNEIRLFIETSEMRNHLFFNITSRLVHGASLIHNLQLKFTLDELANFFVRHQAFLQAKEGSPIIEIAKKRNAKRRRIISSPPDMADTSPVIARISDITLVEENRRPQEVNWLDDFGELDLELPRTIRVQADVHQVPPKVRFTEPSVPRLSIDDLEMHGVNAADPITQTESQAELDQIHGVPQTQPIVTTKLTKSVFKRLLEGSAKNKVVQINAQCVEHHPMDKDCLNEFMYILKEVSYEFKPMLQYYGPVSDSGMEVEIRATREGSADFPSSLEIASGQSPFIGAQLDSPMKTPLETNYDSTPKKRLRDVSVVETLAPAAHKKLIPEHREKGNRLATSLDVSLPLIEQDVREPELRVQEALETALTAISDIQERSPKESAAGQIVEKSAPNSVHWYQEILALINDNGKMTPVEICNKLGLRPIRQNMAAIFHTILVLVHNRCAIPLTAEDSIELEYVVKAQK